MGYKDEHGHSEKKFTIEGNQEAAENAKYGFQKSLMVYTLAQIWPRLCFIPRRSMYDFLHRSEQLDMKNFEPERYQILV